MFNLINLNSPNEVYSLVEKITKNGGFASILYVSPFDKVSTYLLDKLASDKKKTNQDIFVISSWENPTVFNKVHPVTKTPSLVNITKERDYVLSNSEAIYFFLKLS